MIGKKQRTKSVICLLISILVIISTTPVFSLADTAVKRNITVKSSDEKIKKPRVVVSMGDSYSSGEGIPSFYNNHIDWLAHRSEYSWPGLLELPENDKLKDHKASYVLENKDSDNIHWYFVAASGAETKDITGEYNVTIRNGKTNEIVDEIPVTHGQEKRYSRYILDSYHNEFLPPQIEVLNFLKQRDMHPDYITLTLGGNDLGFEKIIEAAANPFQKPNELTELLTNAKDKLQNDIGDEISVKKKLIKAYKDINNAAKSDTKQPCILVAGYPHLIDPKSKEKGFPFNKSEADQINDATDIFNKEIADAVRICREEENLDIWFVDVATDFQGHEAYTDKAWINPITKHTVQDLDQKTKQIGNFFSAYSIHPNKAGAECYAKCVQRFINWKEGLVPTPSLTPTPKPVEIKVMSNEQALKAITNYIYINHPAIKDYVEDESNKEKAPCYWGIDENRSAGNTVVVDFRSYTAAHLYYYIDRISGETYETSWVPMESDDEKRTGVTFNAWDYLNRSVSTPSNTPTTTPIPEPTLPQTPTLSPTQGNTTTPAARPVVKVTTAVNKSFTEYGKTVKYQIPQVSISGKNMDSVNKRIKKNNPEKYSNPKKSGGFGICEVTYSYYINGDILSIIIRYSKRTGDGAPDGYDIYNIRISTGKLLSKKALLKQCGTTEKKFLKNAKKIYKSIKIRKPFFTKYSKSDTLKNCVSMKHISPYVGKNGHLCFAGIVGWEADAGCKEALFDTKTKKCIDPDLKNYLKT